MAIINSYPLDTSISDSDILLGVDSGNNSITKTYTIGSIRTFINSDGGSIVDTNYYLNNITSVPSTGTVTFSVNGATNQILNLGTAAFSDDSEFAAVGHSHTVAQIIPQNGITTTYLNVDGTGTAGNILTSNGLGGFNWASASSIVDTNNYLTGITKSGNTLTFAVSGEVADPTYTFGEGAFLSINNIIAQVAAGINISDIDSSLGKLAALDTVGVNEININSISTEKIQESAVTEAKLKASNSPVSGYVLTSDGSTGFTWAFNSASNYYLSNITKATNTLTFEMSGGLGSSSFAKYTFGGAAFKSVGTTSADVASGNHSHVLANITDVGALAGLNTVSSSEINNGSVTISKLSPAAGTNGQFLTVSGGALAWTTIATTATDFLTLPNTPSTFVGGANKILKVNAGETAVEFATLSIGLSDINTAAPGVAGKVLGINSNGDLEWVVQGGGSGVVFPTSFNGITTNGTAGQVIQTDGDGTFSYLTLSGLSFDGQFSSLTGTPTTIAGYGITDAFDGQFSSLTGTPTTLAGYGITDAITSVSYSNLATEFRVVAPTPIVLSSSNISAVCDFSIAAVFPITLAGDGTLTTIGYSNTSIGQTKILKVTGSGGTGAVTISGVNLGGALDQTSGVINYLQVTCIGVGEFIYTIAQA